MTDFYDYWLKIDKWSFDEAAFIFNGKDPELPECAITFERDMNDFGKQDAEKWQREIYKTYKILSNAEWGKYAGTSARAITHYSKARQRYLFSLAIDKQLKLPDELLKKWEIISKSIPKADEIDKENKPNNYTTKKLEILLEARDKFWSLYDRDDASTAPTNEQVEEWLIEQIDSHGRPISKRAAEVMASILRDESLPPGPRK